MKKTPSTFLRIAGLIFCIAVAVMASFKTENLTEKNRRDQLAEYKPAQLVEAMFRDSLSTLQARAVTIKQLTDSIGNETFRQANSRVLGIGSPLFFVLKGEMTAPTFVDDQLTATIDGVQVVIPMKYIFGNTARDASGWFCIDDFRNTPDFNAVSAEMNRYISKNVTGPNMSRARSLSSESAMLTISFVGAAALTDNNITTLTIIPYILK